MLDYLHRLPGLLVNGTTIWEQGDADVYCILDGCRVDALRAHYPNAESYWSVASNSDRWLRKTFSGDHGRVAYITGNPFGPVVEDRVGYYHLEGVRETDLGVETAPPRRLAAHAAAVWQRRGGLGIDTVVVHFMQPHVPFRSRPEWFAGYRESDEWGACEWRGVASVGRDAWMTAYHDNLQWVLKDGVEYLQERVNATVALTADHGNAAGEWGLYGHPRGVAVPAVRKVPWVTVEGEAVKAVEADPAPAGAVNRDAQLAALGYTDS